MEKWIDIVFDGPPGPEPGRFVEVENEQRAGISFGEWIERDDGYWVLRITCIAEPERQLARAAKECMLAKRELAERKQTMEDIQVALDRYKSWATGGRFMRESLAGDGGQEKK